MVANETTMVHHPQQPRLMRQMQAQLQTLQPQLDEIVRSISTRSTLPDRIDITLADDRIHAGERASPLEQVAESGDRPRADSARWVDSFSDTDEIYIHNAGLIILWPFLNRFFENVGLVVEDHFINLEATERAVLILQSLVDASTETLEHLLPLNKLLCGVDLLEPMALSFELTERERTATETLLLAAIANWSILGNTSIAGFRQAFLQRQGILRICNGSWLLQVERASYDILLERLPWTIRVVKLPWMLDVLYVEW